MARPTDKVSINPRSEADDVGYGSKATDVSEYDNVKPIAASSVESGPIDFTKPDSAGDSAKDIIKEHNDQRPAGGQKDAIVEPVRKSSSSWSSSLSSSWSSGSKRSRSASLVIKDGQKAGSNPRLMALAELTELVGEIADTEPGAVELLLGRIDQGDKTNKNALKLSSEHYRRSQEEALKSLGLPTVDIPQYTDEFLGSALERLRQQPGALRTDDELASGLAYLITSSRAPDYGGFFMCRLKQNDILASPRPIAAVRLPNFPLTGGEQRRSSVPSSAHQARPVPPPPPPPEADEKRRVSQPNAWTGHAKDTVESAPSNAAAETTTAERTALSPCFLALYSLADPPMIPPPPPLPQQSEPASRTANLSMTAPRPAPPPPPSRQPGSGLEEPSPPVDKSTRAADGASRELSRRTSTGTLYSAQSSFSGMITHTHTQVSRS